MTDITAHGTLDAPIVTMRGPADLVDALPYLLGYDPTDSIVLAGLHGRRRRIGGRLRLDLPAENVPEDWPEAADQLAEQLVAGSSAVCGSRPDGAVVYLCGPPAAAKGGTPAADQREAQRHHTRLRRLAGPVRRALVRRGLTVWDVLLVACGRWWSLGHGGAADSSPGTAVARPGTPPIAAAAAYAGFRLRGTLRELEAELDPAAGPAATGQRRALDRAAGSGPPDGHAPEEAEEYLRETVRSARAAVERLRAAAGRPPDGRRPAGPSGRSAPGRRRGRPAAGPAAPGTPSGAGEPLTSDQAARLIVGLGDHRARDLAAAWVEHDEIDAARTLWLLLARRCVTPYERHATVPLSLLGWVRWLGGDTAGARVALNRALRLDPDHTFAALLHDAVNVDVSPLPLLATLRAERRERERRERERHAPDGPG